MAKSQRTLLLTGATGFVGRNVCAKAVADGWRVQALVRDAKRLPPGVTAIIVPNLSVPSKELSLAWDKAVRSCLPEQTAAIHLAGRAHIVHDVGREEAAEFHRHNVVSAVLARQESFSRRVKRFVFVSSIGAVTGGSSQAAIGENFPAHPTSPYGRSKLEAERALMALNLPGLVIVRPPLVYGPGAPGNIGRLAQLVRSGIPLPFGRVQNQRSLIHVANLADVLLLCCEHERAAGRVFHVRDYADFSTIDLLEKTAACLGRRARLFSAPLWSLKLLMKLLGQPDAFEKITGSLRVDDRLIRQELGWRPTQRPFEI
jgi:nucleoside-diphosphate-sugar epimerase